MEQCNDVGQTLIIIAVVKRNKEIVQSLLDYHPKPNVKAKDNYGRSVLHYALRGYGGDEMVEMLVKSGADVNAPCSEGLPIHFAVINNKPKSLEILAAHNAYLEAKDPGGRTAMVLAVKYQRDDLVQILLEAGAIFDRTLFTDAISKQFIRRLEAYEILPRLEGISINNASRRERTDSVGTAYNLPRVLRRFIKPR
ncbi:ankyrin repeat-containing domain protein [Calycina marina]|uniref:Ankyrin repeat-containing domain protein n=1 Tax=Calycina marina TaxID=1763456 RepID=A0A9P8CEC4_9HELO|nr:ankyrin repeat-containing domain protein [Calycina marina]